MDVQILDTEGKLVWARAPIGGYTSSAYRSDGTLEQIKKALELALAQCKGELAVWDNPD